MIQTIDGSFLSSDDINDMIDKLKQHGIEDVSSDILGNQVVLRFNDLATQSQAFSDLKTNILSAKMLKNLRMSLQISRHTPTFFQWFNAKPMRLGLDLQGGVNLTMRVSLDHDASAAVDIARSKITALFNDDPATRIGGYTIKSISDTDFSIHFNGDGAQSYFNKAVSLMRSNDVFKSILVTFSYQIDESQKTIQFSMLNDAISNDDETKMEDTIRILNNRTNELGVSEAVIYRVGNDSISINIPGIQDPILARELIGNTASLTFHLGTENAPTTRYGKSITLPYEGRNLSFYERPVLTGDAIVNSKHAYQLEPLPPRWIVSVNLDGQQTEWYKTTNEFEERGWLAIVYHEFSKNQQGELQEQQKIISYAKIGANLGDQFQITGNFSEQSAKELSMLIRSGSFKAPVDIVQEKVIGPSLGADNIQKGAVSLGIGLLLIFTFMAVYYRGFGMLANLGLVVNLFLTVAMLSILGATLTLPGIAGIVLGVGMAVDANVLINERIREELRKGASVFTAIQSGYDKAFITIVDANVTTLIVALVLFGLGTAGLIKGFAVTLTIGLIASMLTSVFFTRTIAMLIYGKNAKTISIGI